MEEIVKGATGTNDPANTLRLAADSLIGEVWQLRKENTNLKAQLEAYKRNEAERREVRI